MMGYGGWSQVGLGWGAMWGVSWLGAITWLVIIVDLILLGFWLWKQIKK